MKRGFVIAGVAAILALTMTAADARGYRGHGGYYGGGHHSHFSLSLGVPLYWGPYPRPYYAPYYYEPRTIIIEREPPVYIQRQPVTVVPAPSYAPAPAAAANVWYYCPNPAGYYPYVQSCSQAWVSVDPNSVAPPR